MFQPESDVSQSQHYQSHRDVQTVKAGHHIKTSPKSPAFEGKLVKSLQKSPLVGLAGQKDSPQYDT